MIFKYILPLSLILLTLNYFNSLVASDSIANGDSVIIYGDGSLSEIFKFTKKDIKDDLKERTIKIQEKNNKKAGLSDLAADLEKDVIKKKPEVVILNIPCSDFYDNKKKTLVAGYDSTSAFAHITNMVKALQSSGITVILSTPCIAGENIGGDPDIDAAIDSLATLIRDYCAEQKITCCDYRKVASDYLTQNNPDKKAKGILSKNGVRIHKKGAEILAAALKKCLGMSSNGIGGPLLSSDRVVLFTCRGTPFGTGSKQLAENIQTIFRAKYAEITGPGKPNCKEFKLSDVLFQIHPTTTQYVTSQKARVSFIHLTHFNHKSAAIDKYEQRLIEKFNTMCADIAASKPSGSVFLFTEAVANPDPKDPQHVALVKVNKIITQAAEANGILVFDLYALHNEARARNPQFKLVSSNGKYYSPEFLELIENKMAHILGLVK